LSRILAFSKRLIILKIIQLLNLKGKIDVMTEAIAEVVSTETVAKEDLKDLDSNRKIEI
jgi:hypothetical protein